jgi:hypothetical protein
MTTLGNEPLQFNPNTQKIVESTEEDFTHPLAKQIWDMVMKCKELEDGDMITVSVPFNNARGFFLTGKCIRLQRRPVCKGFNLLSRKVLILTLITVGYEFLRLVPST